MSSVGVRDYRDLRVWQSAMGVTAQVFKLCMRLPAHQRYGLASQLQRASVSVAANIAEGNGRSYLGDYARFLSIARGSAFELATLLELTILLSYVPASDVAPIREKLAATTRMLTALLMSIRAAAVRQTKAGAVSHFPLPITHNRC